jgi:hypothetical protein
MLVAQQKLNENIAEYIIYMYHVEDVIRAFQFNLDALIENYVKHQLPDEAFIAQYREWYADLIRQMKQEQLEKNGHLSIIKEYIVELTYLHTMLIDVLKDQKYIDLFEQTRPIITEFGNRSNMIGHNPIEIAFHSQYMKLLMKLHKEDISPETETAFDQMRIFIAYLAKKYHQMRAEN